MSASRPLDLSDVRAELQSRGIDVLRVLYSDVLGITRSKDMLVTQLERALGHGPTFCQGVWVTNTQGGVLDFFNNFTGGALERMSIIALGVMPYITASIVVQLATSLSPQLAAIRRW